MNTLQTTLVQLEVDLLKALRQLQRSKGFSAKRKWMQRLELLVLLEYVRELKQKIATHRVLQA